MPLTILTVFLYTGTAPTGFTAVVTMAATVIRRRRRPSKWPDIRTCRPTRHRRPRPTWSYRCPPLPVNSNNSSLAAIRALTTGTITSSNSSTSNSSTTIITTGNTFRRSNNNNSTMSLGRPKKYSSNSSNIINSTLLSANTTTITIQTLTTTTIRWRSWPTMRVRLSNRFTRRECLVHKISAYDRGSTGCQICGHLLLHKIMVTI